MSSTPSIRISQHHRRAHSPPEPPPAAAALPMAIPHARESVPPPLPPPSFLPELSTADTGWIWGNDPNRSDFGRPATVKPGSSLLGGGTECAPTDVAPEAPPQDAVSEGRRGSSISTITGGQSYDMPGDSSGYSEGGTRPGLSRPTSYGYVERWWEMS